MAHKWTKSGVISAIVMGVLTVILLPILIINVTLIIKGSSSDGRIPPDIFGIAPLAVETGSMAGDRPDSFGEGALIFIEILSDEEKNSLKEGDIVTYYVEENGSLMYVTHRIFTLNKQGDRLESIVTSGDANNGALDPEVEAANIIGRCTGSVEGLGAFAMFLQTPVGILVFVGIPVVAFIAFDAIRITLYNRKVKAEEASDKALAAKDEEIARLKAMLASPSQEEGAPPSPAEQPPSEGDNGE